MAALATSAVPAMDHPWPLQLLGEHLAPSPGQHRGQHEAPLRVREGWSCDRDRWREEGQGGAGTAPAPSGEPAQIPGDAVVANAPASPQSPAGPGEGGEALAIASTTGCASSAGPCQGLIRLVPFPRRPLGRLRLGGGIHGWDGKEKPVKVRWCGGIGVEGPWRTCGGASALAALLRDGSCLPVLAPAPVRPWEPRVPLTGLGWGAPAPRGSAPASLRPLACPGSSQGPAGSGGTSAIAVPGPSLREQPLRESRCQGELSRELS